MTVRLHEKLGRPALIAENLVEIALLHGKSIPRANMHAAPVILQAVRPETEFRARHIEIQLPVGAFVHAIGTGINTQPAVGAAIPVDQHVELGKVRVAAAQSGRNFRGLLQEMRGRRLESREAHLIRRLL